MDFSKWLLAALTTAFMAWAGVVWVGVSDVRVLNRIIEDTDRELTKHQAAPWHDEAGHMIRVNEVQRLRIQEDLERLEKKVDKILQRLNSTGLAEQ